MKNKKKWSTKKNPTLAGQSIRGSKNPGRYLNGDNNSM